MNESTIEPNNFLMKLGMGYLVKLFIIIHKNLHH